MTIVRKISIIIAVGLMTSVSLPSYAGPLEVGTCVIPSTAPVSGSKVGAIALTGTKVYRDPEGKQLLGTIAEMVPMYVVAKKGKMVQVVRDIEVDDPNAPKYWGAAKDFEAQSKWSCE